jgi:glycosyltransferase 2 family protein
LLRWIPEMLPIRPLTRLLPAVLVVAFALWCAVKLRSDLSGTSLAPVWHSWNLVLIATLLSVFNYVFRAIRWRWYLARLGYVLPFDFACLTYSSGFAFTLSPGKLGEVVRARYYTPLGIPLRDVAAVFCLERLLDVLAVLALATFVVGMAPRYSNAIWGAALGLGGFTALAVALPALLRRKEAPRLGSRSALYPVGRPTQVSRIKRLLASAVNVLEAAKPLVVPSAFLVGFVSGLCAWGLEGVGLYVLSSMFPAAHLTLPVALGIYGVAVLAGALAMLPGGVGGTEAVMATLLVSQGYPLAAALLITLVCRLVTLWFAVVLGWAAIMTLRIRGPAVEVTPWQ